MIHNYKVKKHNPYRWKTFKCPSCNLEYTLPVSYNKKYCKKCILKNALYSYNRNQKESYKKEIIFEFMQWLFIKKSWWEMIKIRNKFLLKYLKKGE